MSPYVISFWGDLANQRSGVGVKREMTVRQRFQV